MVGCGGAEFFTVDSPDDLYDKLPAYDAARAKPPADLEKFSTVLSKSKLQYPNDKSVVDYDSFDGFKSPFFYALDGDLWFRVTKTITDHKVRSELREGPGDWHTGDREGHFWHATLWCPKPAKGIDSYTWMQIHGTYATFNYPPLRLMWVRNYDKKYDHLWAIVIVSDPYKEKVYEWIDMGKRPDRFFDANVTIRNNEMDIYIDGKLIKHYDMTYWSSVKNYFKAGVYVNRHDDHGEAAVVFKTLKQ